MTQEELLEKINLGEDNEVEFKSAKGGLPKSIWESVSAFANTNGGYIILGVEEDDNSEFHIGSLNNSTALVKNFWNLHNSSQKLSSPLCSEDHVSIFNINGSEIVVIHIPVASRTQRPVFINGNPYIGTYKRNSDGDYRCIESEIKQMIRDASDEPQDFSIVEGFTLDDIDPETLNAYKNRFSSRQSDHAYLSLNNKELLIKLGGYKVDRKTNKEGLTLAGLLMFGKESSILEAFPHFHLDYQEKLSDDKEVRWNYRITSDGTWECNIFNFYFRAYNRLVQDIEVPFALDKDGVRLGETHVHEAIREALVNSLVHANHQSSKSIKIIKAHDHFAFMNPGRLRIPIEQMYSGGVSDARNPYIQRMFQFLGLGEKAGSGFEKILRAWKEQSWLMPLVSEKIDLDMTLVLLPFLSMVPEKVNKELSSLIGDDYKQLNELERLILTLAHQFESISNQEISRYTKTHPKDIGEELKRMVNKEWLVPDGIGKGRIYKLNLDFEKTQSLQHLDQSLQHLDSSLQHSPVIQEVRNSKRSSRDHVIKAILEACSNSYLSVTDLSTLLNRNVESLRNHYVSKMVKDGLLKTKYEDINHPDQAYTKVTK